MKSFISLVFILLLAAQSNAETYSWVDDSGTYNFTEDYSSIPKKYRKKVKRRDNALQDVKPQSVQPTETKSGPVEKTVEKSKVATDGDKTLYGGKSRDTWRKELDAWEAELQQIVQRMGNIRSQINESVALPRVQYNLLKKEYDDLQASYDQKNKGYTELIETIRKAGIPVEIKK